MAAAPSISDRISCARWPPAAQVVAGFGIRFFLQQRQDQFAQQWGDFQQAALGADQFRFVRADVERAQAHRAEHADFMRQAARHPQRTLRRDDPEAVRGAHLHDAFGRVQQLAARMRVLGEQLVVIEVAAEGDYRMRQVLQLGGFGAGVDDVDHDEKWSVT